MTKMKRLFPLVLAVTLLAGLCACGGSSADVSAPINPAPAAPTTTVSDSVTPEPTATGPDLATTNPEPIVKNIYNIYNILTPFSEERTWVEFIVDNNKVHCGIIDTEGNLIYDATELYESSIASGNIVATVFSDGVSCLHGDNSLEYGERRPGLWIINVDGEVIFNSNDAGENTQYYFLGYGCGIFVAIQNTADFTSNKKYICEIDTNGSVVSQVELPDDFVIQKISTMYVGEQLKDDLIYYGDGIFIGTYPNQGSMIYSLESHQLRAYNRVKMMGNFFDGVAVINDGEYFIESSTLKDYCNSGQLNFSANKLELPGYTHYVSEGLINYPAPSGYVRYDSQTKTYIPIVSGIYDYRGNLVASYPDNWEIVDMGKYSGGFASFILKGADGNNYVTILDRNGQQQYDPVKIDSYEFPSWHGYVSVTINGAEMILSPTGEKTDISEINQISNTYTIGDIEVCNGFELTGYNPNDGKILRKYTSFTDLSGNVVSCIYEYEKGENFAQEPPVSSDEPKKNYVNLSSFTIEGKWKNIGTYTFGQVSSGAIVAFDGTHCNVVSPQDTYAIYKNGDNYRLDCTTLLGDTLSFTIRTVDEDNIDIYYGSNYLEMTRVD